MILYTISLNHKFSNTKKVNKWKKLLTGATYVLDHQMQLGFLDMYLCTQRTNVYTTHITHLENAPISHTKWYYVNINFIFVFFFLKNKKKSKLTIITFEICLYIEKSIFSPHEPRFQWIYISLFTGKFLRRPRLIYIFD